MGLPVLASHPLEVDISKKYEKVTYQLQIMFYLFIIILMAGSSPLYLFWIIVPENTMLMTYGR